MARRQDKRITRTRNIIIGCMAAIILVILGYGTIYSTGVTEGEYRSGEHYRVVDNAPRRRAGAPVTVHEYFSYACVHCRNFDPLLEAWVRELPARAEFERSPVAFSPAWQLLAQTYYALEQLGALEANHVRLFRAIHDNGRQFRSADAVAEFVDGNGTTKADFLRALKSPEVARRVRHADAEQRRLQISSVPTLAVAGRYVVNMDLGRKIALDVADHLVDRELADGPAAPEDSGSPETP